MRNNCAATFGPDQIMIQLTRLCGHAIGVVSAAMQPSSLSPDSEQAARNRCLHRGGGPDPLSKVLWPTRSFVVIL